MLQTLIDYGFTQVGVIFVDEVGQVRSKITDPDFDLPLDEPSVYAWVDGQDVKYVGKASKGIRKRLGEHRGGWRGGSGTGMKNATLIRETIVASREVMKIYGRRSDKTTCFGVEVSLVSTEEEALIMLLDPPWNGRNKS
jgi:hypothetical protein